MSKIKTLVVGALALAASFVSGSASAATGDVISINVFQDGTAISQDQQTLASETVKFPAGAWLTLGQPSGGNKSVSGNTGFNLTSGSTVTLPSSVTASIYSQQGSNWADFKHNGTDGYGDNPAYAYLSCWGSNRDRTCIPGWFKLENIPFEKYDVILYFQGGTSQGTGEDYGHPKVEGQTPTGFDPIRVTSGNSSFTASHYYKPDENGVLSADTGLSANSENKNNDVITLASLWGQRAQSTAAYGVNATIVKDCSGTFEIHYWARTAAIAAVQIVDTTPVAKEVTVSGSEVKVSDINSAVEAAGGAAEDVFEVTLSEATSLTFDTTLAFAKAKIIRDGALALISDSEPADYAKFDFNGVTGFITHDWYRFNGKKVIAINFNASNRSEGENNISKALDVDAYGRIWKNVTDANGSTDVPVYDTATQSATEDTATIVWSSANNWQRDNTDAPFLNGYLDDGGNRAHVSIESVPFEYYDVVVYGHGDGSKINQVTVNGTDYIADSNGKAVPGSGNWGDSAYQTTAWGKNALLIEKQSGSLSIIGGPNSNGGRGPICAIMIVETQATVKDVDCGTAYDISNANAFTEDIVNLNFATEGGVLTLDEAPARDFNIVSEGAIMVKFGSGVSIDGSIAKLNCNGVEGGVKFVITDGTIPTTAPAAGITYRWEGETALTAIPFAGVAVAGTLEIACQIAVAADAKIEIANSHNSYVFEDGFSLATSQLVIGNNAGSVQNFTQNGGTITLTKEYTGSDTTTLMPLLLAHWDTTCTYNLVGGSITAENGNVMFGRDGKIAMTVGGGDTTAIFKARGINRDARTNPCSLTIAENGIVQLGVGGIDFGANKKVVLDGGTLGAYDNATITTTMNLEVTAASTINVAEGKTLTLAAPLSGSGAITKTGAGKLVITGSRAGYTGTITIAEGSYDIGSVRDFATVTGITTSGTGFISATAIVADDGEVKIINVPVGTSLVVYDLDGTTQLPTTVVGTTVTAKSSIATDGEACLYDWTFKADSLTSVGQVKATMTWDTGYKDGQEHASERILESEDFVYGKALNTKATPYSDFTINYPIEWTCVVAGIVPNNENAALIAFGTSTGGSIAILKGSTDTEVIIARTTGNSAYQSLATMQVANALTTSHTYAFVKTANSITVYLDGNLWNVTPVSNVSFGNRIQVGSIHGGKQQTMIESSKDATNATAIQAVRIFEGALGPNALKQLADEFPYNSPNGTFAREFEEGEDTWIATDSWVNTKTSEVADLPAAGATLNISAAGEASITVNLTEATEYEAMTFSGETMTFKAGDAEAINIGLTTVAAPITIEYGSISIANGPFVVSGDGSVAFDYSDAPVSTFAKIGFVALTGTTDDLGDKVTCTALPSAPAGRAISFGYSAEHKAYGVTTVADREATTLYLKSSTTLSDDTLFAMTEDGEADMPRLFEDDVIVVPADITLTIPTTALAIPLTTPIKGAGTIAVTGATLTEASPLFTVAEDWAGAVEFTNTTVTGADLNSYGNANTTVKLTGVVGYLKSGVEFKPEIILENNNLAGLELTDGSSGSTVIFSKVSGTGNFIGNKAGVTQKIAVIDASEHTGQVRMVGGMGVTLGSDAGTVDSAKIAVADGATIAFAGQTWIAEGGVTFGDTLTVVGDVGSYITMPEPAALPAITLASYNRDYMLKYVDGKLTVAYAEVEVVIPEIAGTTVEVWVSGSEEAITPVEGKVSIPYGADMTVLYIVKEGKLFKNGDYMLPLEYENVTEDPEIANDITEDDVTVDAGARIDDVDYLDIPAALADAEPNQTVIVLQNAALESLTIPEDVTLDLNRKTVLAAAIENNGMIVIYDEATTMALIDTHGTIKFGDTVVLSVGYMFPEGTIVTVKKVQGVPGATRSVITVPEEGILVNLVGAAAKKDITVQFENPFNSTLLLAGAIERGSHDYDTQLNVGGITTVGAPLIIGLDGKGMDYETYPDNKAKLISTYVQFDDDLVPMMVGEQVYACIQLIPEVGVLQTATDLSSVIGTRLVTINGAEIKDSFDGTIHTYTAEWIKPEATVEAMTDKPEELDAAATFKATEAGASKYDDYTASLTITSDKDVAQDAIILAGQFNATDLEDPAGINNNYDGEWIDMPLASDLTAGEPYAVIDMPWNFVTENVKIFNCGLKNIALTEETTFTVTLTIAKDDDTVLTKDIEFTIPAAKILPTADVEEIIAEDYEAAVEFTAEKIGQGYENWTAEFILTSDVAIGADEIALGGSYDAWLEGAWVDIAFPGCAAGEPISVLGLGGYDDITVKTVFDTIQSFKCGVKNIALKNDATFTLKFVITDGETTKEICSIDNLTVAAAITPVKPGEDIKIPEGADPEDFASIVNANLEKYLIVPDVVEDAPAYRSLFAAKVVDGTKVAIMLTDTAKTEIAGELEASAGEILTPNEEGKATITAKPGLYYGIKAVAEIKAMSAAEGQNWVQATGDTVEVEVPVLDSNKAFFKSVCTPSNPIK